MSAVSTKVNYKTERGRDKLQLIQRQNSRAWHWASELWLLASTYFALPDDYISSGNPPASRPVVFLNTVHVKVIISNLLRKGEEPWDKVKCILWKKEKESIKKSLKNMLCCLERWLLSTWNRPKHCAGHWCIHGSHLNTIRWPGFCVKYLMFTSLW